MDIQRELAHFKVRVDREIARYLDRTISETTKHDPFMTEALRYVKSLVLSGGKRLRASFMYYGYLAAGGTDRERMLRATVSIELIHIFLLIHDDIIDRDEKRHGIETAHEHFRFAAEKLFPHADSAHFGSSMAIIIGDMVGALGNQIIFESGFPPDRILRALSKLQDIISFTVVGQAKDILIEFAGKATEKEILAMYEHKTARYTIDGPLQLGVILAGGSEELADAFGRYAIPLGIAFQIQDDILGVFGSEEKVGKPIGSDIEEGKISILVSRALSLVSKHAQQELSEILRKGKDLSRQDIDRFREILIESGALASAKETAKSYIDIGRREIVPIELPAEAKDFLIGIADYMMSREY
ncbi:MAG: polyprenyl synthetase family protein [Candidatus Moraniibacteriota bacterium]|nr:MAG: polyprenyl synthetase family protein [Candidatus Moranbacteria bacterium]